MPESRSFVISAELGFSCFADANLPSRRTIEQMYDSGYVESETFCRDLELSISAIPINVGLKLTQNPLNTIAFWLGATITTALMSFHQKDIYNLTGGFDDGNTDVSVDESAVGPSEIMGQKWRYRELVLDC
jgi:hypothetical protein